MLCSGLLLTLAAGLSIPTSSETAYLPSEGMRGGVPGHPPDGFREEDLDPPPFAEAVSSFVEAPSAFDTASSAALQEALRQEDLRKQRAAAPVERHPLEEQLVNVPLPRTARRALVDHQDLTVFVGFLLGGCILWLSLFQEVKGEQVLRVNGLINLPEPRAALAKDSFLPEYPTEEEDSTEAIDEPESESVADEPPRS